MVDGLANIKIFEFTPSGINSANMVLLQEIVNDIRNTDDDLLPMINLNLEPNNRYFGVVTNPDPVEQYLFKQGPIRLFVHDHVLNPPELKPAIELSRFEQVFSNVGFRLPFALAQAFTSVSTLMMSVGQSSSCMAFAVTLVNFL